MTPDDDTRERHLRAAVESSPSGLLMVDAVGTIVLVNREIERLFGYAREELLGRSVDMLLPEEMRGGHGAFRSSFLKDPKVRSMGAGRDLYGLRKDGRKVPLEIGLTPVATEQGMFVLSAVVDISERKRAEEERRRLERHLRQAQKMEAVGTLAGGIAHDFNNILGGIQGYAELVRDEVHDPPLRADLDELLAFVQRGKSLVQRIRAFGHRPETRKVPISLAGPVQEVARFLRSSVGPRIRIETRIEEHLPRVVADASAMHQVLMNLAMNAAQSMPEGGDVAIDLSSLYLRDSEARQHPELREGRHVVITVRDTGTGIPDAVKDRVFEPFFTTKAPGQGSGLGLAIVHSIVREHAGAVELESAVGVGTSVRVKLPAVELPEAEPERTPAAPRGRGERILYVDDEPGLASLGERRLKGLGYEVVTAGDGEDALRILREDREGFDAVVTDHLMPRMTGTELASEAIRVRPGLPIILLTGYVEDLPEEEIRSRGVSRILAKPATLEELATILRTALDEPGAADDPDG